MDPLYRLPQFNEGEKKDTDNYVSGSIKTRANTNSINIAVIVALAIQYLIYTLNG